ncbi:homoserine O-succinyltransferase [Sphingomonas sp.]|uniref:homoserine O-succinyltransferase MetX n=1 Tax=Sphingomonas sp. TaxID=28214 RepID=UPI0025F9CA2F|nr:homoserine O-succinyltransferase [Sphingomonas sp.]
MIQQASFEDRSVAAAVRGELPLSLRLRHAGPTRFIVGYELTGPTNAPLIIVAGGISAGRHSISSKTFSEPGWWESQSEALSGHRLLSIDWLGADGEFDRPIDPADQAEAIAALLDALGLGRAAGFVGASYGGMVGMHLAARNPDSLGSLLAISAPARAHPFASACRSIQRRALDLGEAGGEPDAGVALARAMAMLTYRTPREFAERFDASPVLDGGRLRVAADPYLDAQGQRHCRRMSPAAYRRLSESIDLHRIDAADIRVPVTLAAVDSDALVPESDVRPLAKAIPGSRLHVVRSRFGHDAFLKEDAQVAAILIRFLASLETTR